MRNCRSIVELSTENLQPSLPMTVRLALSGVGLALSIACAEPSKGPLLLGGEEPEVGVSGAGGSSGGMSSPQTGGNMGHGPDLNLGGDFSGGGGSGGRVGNGIPEECDGLDNDANGIIDDVDVGQDGVCDCLKIATIGQIGPWSDGGNIFVSWLGARSPQGAVALGDQILTPELLAPFRVIVSLHVDTTSVDWLGTTTPAHHAFSAAESAAFKSWVEAGGTILARGAGAAPALQVAQVQNGRVVVWGDEWITYDSEWEDIEDQQVELFWLNILKWLTPPTECQVPIPPSVH